MGSLQTTTETPMSESVLAAAKWFPAPPLHPLNPRLVQKKTAFQVTGPCLCMAFVAWKLLTSGDILSPWWVMKNG